MTTATTKPGGRTLAAQARTAAMIAEIEYLLTCGEGEHAITRAFGIKPDSLERRLYRAGRPDLIPRIFEHAARLYDQRQHSAYFIRIAYAKGRK